MTGSASVCDGRCIMVDIFQTVEYSGRLYNTLEALGHCKFTVVERPQGNIFLLVACLRVCIFVYIYIYIHMCVYIYICICMYVYIYI